MPSMYISENPVKNTLKNRRIKIKQRGKHRRRTHKAKPEVFLWPGTSDSFNSCCVNVKNTSSGAYLRIKESIFATVRSGCVGYRQGLFALKFQDTGTAGLSKESEAMTIGSLLWEKQRKPRLNCEPLCRQLPWLGWIKIKRIIYTTCVLLRIPVILVVASPPRRLSVKAGPKGSQIIQRWALVRKEPFQVPQRTLYIKANR